MTSKPLKCLDLMGVCYFARLAWLRAGVPCAIPCLRTHALGAFARLHAYVLGVLACSRAWRAFAFACFACLRACYNERFYFLTCLRTCVHGRTHVFV